MKRSKSSTKALALHHPACVALIAGLVVLADVRGDALDSLHLRNPLPSPEQLRAITFGGGKFVAADSRGDVFESVNGSSWTAIGSVGSNQVIRIAYGAGRYVAATFGGQILSSEDGSTWTVRASGSLPGVFAYVTYGNEKFVANAPAGTILTSPDGIQWTANVTGLTLSFNDVAFGNGLFVGVSSGSGFIYSSTDGVSWTPHQPDAGYTRSGGAVVFGNGIFVASGIVSSGGTGGTPWLWTSPNGVDWVRLPAAGPQIPFYGGGTFVVLSGSTVRTSPNLTQWVTNSLPSGLTGGRLSYGNGVFVNVGGQIIGTSPNGLDWTAVSIPVPDREFDVSSGAYGAGRYVLAGRSLVSSTDGLNFTRNTTIPAIEGLLMGDVIYAAGQFVMVGSHGRIFRSADGETWNAARSGTLRHLNAIAYGAGRYVAVGESGIIRTSEDGSLWFGANSGTDYSLKSVSFGGGKFVAVGHSGIVLTSSDGMTWIPRNNSDFSTLNKIIHAQGWFLTVGDAGAVLTSPDSVTWTRQGTFLDFPLVSITYGDGLYAAVASVQVGTDVNGNPIKAGRIYASTDGLVWQQKSGEDFSQIKGGAFLNNTFVLMGQAGNVFQSDPVGVVVLSAASNPANGAFEIKVRSNEIGTTYRLQACTNMLSGVWTDVTTFTQTQLVTTIILQDGTGRPECYYRAVTP